MFIDRNGTLEFPYNGRFYKIEKTSSGDGDPLGSVTTEVTLLDTVCDIIESNKVITGSSVTADFNIYFPIDRNFDIPIQRGVLFKGSAFGMEVSGTVIGLNPSQITDSNDPNKIRCSAYIKISNS